MSAGYCRRRVGAIHSMDIMWMNQPVLISLSAAWSIVVHKVFGHAPARFELDELVNGSSWTPNIKLRSETRIQPKKRSSLRPHIVHQLFVTEELDQEAPQTMATSDRCQNHFRAEWRPSLGSQTCPKMSQSRSSKFQEFVSTPERRKRRETID